MSSIEQHAALYNALERSQRAFEGVRAGAASCGQHGVAAFAWWEAEERREYASQVAHHVEGHGGSVVPAALPAPHVNFDSISEMIDTVSMYDDKVLAAIEVLLESIMNAGEDPYFIIGLKKKLKRDMEETESAQKMFSGVTEENMVEANRMLLEKYSCTGCSCR